MRFSSFEVPAFVGLAFGLGLSLSPWLHPDAAHASVTTAAPYVQTVPGGASISDPSVAIMQETVDSINQVIRLTYYFGTSTTNDAGQTTAFAPDLSVAPVTVSFSLTTDTYSASTGLSGALTPTEIATLQASMVNASGPVRNAGESFAVAHNIFGAGATVNPW